MTVEHCFDTMNSWATAILSFSTWVSPILKGDMDGMERYLRWLSLCLFLLLMDGVESVACIIFSSKHRLSDCENSEDSVGCVAHVDSIPCSVQREYSLTGG